MLKPTFQITSSPVKDNVAKVVIEPLPTNFGHTVGNALRRVMLTSLAGGAATKVKIAGVSHQFSSVKGMHEDVLEFILNLKELRFKLDDDKEATVRLSVSGKKKVTAKDLDLPAGVEVTNPDHHLVNLTDSKSKLSATITVVRGMGYASADENATGEVGVIPLDASFSPVRNVTYKIESTRVGRRTDFDKVILDITTDGTLQPIEAVQKASVILSNFFTQVHSPAPVEDKPDQKQETNVPDGFVEDLDLPTRTTNALKKGGYEKLGDLAVASMSDLKQIKNLGEKSVEEIVEKLSKRDIIIK